MQERNYYKWYKSLTDVPLYHNENDRIIIVVFEPQEKECAIDIENLEFIIVMLPLSHISVAFRIIRSILVHIGPN